MFPQQTENHLKMLEMLFLRFGEYQNVIEVNAHAFVEMRPKYAIHSMLEQGRGVGETERHHLPLKFAKMSVESCFRDIRVAKL